MEATQKVEGTIYLMANHMRRHFIAYFMIYLFLYFTLFIIFIYFPWKYNWFKFESYAWYEAGLIIGAIYVFIPLYYFSAHFLYPLAREISTTAKGTGNYPRIGLWAFQWIVPTIILQTFTVFGFWITTERSPFKDSIYVQPYKYGKLYKEVENLKSPLFDARMTEIEFKKATMEKESLMRSLIPYLKHPPYPATDELISYDYNFLIISTLTETETIIYKIPFFIAVAFGFLGTLIYSLRDLAYRFYTQDLLPKTFVNYLIRFIMVPSLCIVIAYFFMNDWPTNIAPILFFAIGFFPHRAVQFIEEKTMNYLSLKKEETHPLPLSLLQGMTDYRLYRFHEIGVADVQNLAFIDLSYLANNLGFGRKLIYDFVSQALLCIHVREDFAKFQNNQIRGITTLKYVMERINSEAKPEEIPIIIRDKQFLLSCIFENEIIRERIEMLKMFWEKSRDWEKEQIDAIFTVS